MAGSNTSTTTYALQKSLRGNLRFLSMFAHLAGRDLSPSISLLLKFVNPDSPCEVLTSWSFLSIAVFWLWMLASRLGMLAVILLVASAPWWLALLPEDTPTLLATAYKTTTRLLVGEMEALFVQQATEINGLIVSLQASQAENEALTVRLREAEQRMDEGAFNSCESEFVGKLQDAQIEMMSMALTLTEKTEELATKESELEETKAELEESKLLAQDAKRIPALVNMIEDLQGELETAKELLVEKERSLQDEREQVCEKEQELGELVDELEALRDAEYRARTGAAGTARTMVQLRTNLTVARAEVASLTTELSAQEAVVASITTQLAEQEAETAMANQEIDELREQADQGNQALHGIVDQANKKIHRRNAEVSRLWAFLQVRLAEVDGLRWELGLWHDEAAQLKKALEVFQPPTPPSDSASMEEVEPASDLPTIVVQSPSSEWVREEKQKINKSLLRAPKRNTRTKSKLPKKKGSKSVSAPSTSTSLSSPSPSTSPSSSSSSANLPAAQPELSSPLITSNNVTPSPCLEEATSPTTPPSLTTIALPVDETIPQCLVVDQITPTPSSTDDELRLTSSPRHEDSILPSRAHDQSMPSPQPVHDATFPISLSRIDNTIPPVSVKPMNSHISALKADSKAFWAPKRSLTISLRLRRNPLGSISGNAPRHSRFRNQNQDQNSLKLADITCEVDEGSWTMVSID